jgi:hypothetical protein
LLPGGSHTDTGDILLTAITGTALAPLVAIACGVANAQYFIGLL